MAPWEWLRSHVLALPLARFALGMVVIFGVPPLVRRLRLPAVVGLLLAGVVLGPYVLRVFGENTPVASFFAQLGKLLLMFFAGLEIDLALFRQAERKCVTFGIFTTGFPLLLGTAAGLLFGYRLIPALVIGSLLASHTLISMPIVTRLGANRFEPVVVTVGATVMSDTLSLVVFAVCVSTYQRGFSISQFALQILEIAIVIPVIVFGLGRAGEWALKKVENDEDAYFVLMLLIMAAAGLLAGVVNLPGIVGAFLAGLAVNTAVRETPAKEKLEFFGNSFFIPIFFVVTGFLINPAAFAKSIIDNFALAAAIILALLVGKGIAAGIASHAFEYTSATRMTMWALTLPQVAATLAAALVGFDTVNTAGQRLIDDKMFNVVFVLMLTTSILGPVLTEHFTPMMLASQCGKTPIDRVA
jgi:Kef-type K+ transport system membrane component KefB